MSDSQQRGRISSRLSRIINPVAALLYRFNFTPNRITVAGAFLSAVAAGFIVFHQLYWAGLIFAFASLLDVFDGAVARVAGKSTQFGAFLDSTLDRFSEGLIFAGLAHYFASDGQTLLVGITIIVMMNSFLISYTRARAEGLHIKCSVGLLQRPERVILLCAGLILNIVGFIIVLLFLLTTITVLQRVIHVAMAFGDE